MHDNRWWIWAAVFLLFIAFRALRAVVRRGSGAPPKDGMARLNAAAQRILQERGAAASPGRAKQPRQPAQNQPRSQAAHAPRPVTAPNTPAVIRRSGLISAGSEPVIQRRR